MSHHRELRRMLRAFPVRLSLTGTGRSALRLLAMVGLVVFLNAAPACCLSVTVASEAPVEQSETAEEAPALHVQIRARDGQGMPGMASRVVMRHGGTRAMVRPTSSRPGHRLSNNLLAPLRC